LQLGVFPFGVIYGIMAIESGLTPIQAFLMSSIIFGGASQIAFVQLITNASPLGVIVTTVGAINSRHFLYSISMMEYLKTLSIKWRIVLAYLLTDEAYAISIRRFINEPNSPFLHFHLLGTGITLFLSWQISTLTGILLGGDLPQFLELQFIIPLTFIAIIVPMIKSISTFLVVVTSAFIGLILKSLDINFWIIFSGIIGVVIGLAFSNLDKKR
ncbi:AzlC family ABC transporter permease, partial [Alphaproteobacteria bacterium]|nr:AzlC family ABC transporter permease [Alphaproteobacteria bacterium]